MSTACRTSSSGCSLSAVVKDLGAIFKAYDVRGVYPDEFDDDAAYRIGGAFARFVDAGTVLVGRDMRESSGPLSRAFIRGATESGADVIDLGLVSTDLVYFASGARDLPGAMFTASHNPARYNGIKFCRRKAAPVGQDTGLAQIREGAESGVDPAASPGTVTSEDMLEAFADHLLGLVDTSKLRPLVVAVDAANGMGGKIVPAVFDRLPVRLVPLYFELDGTFPNHPADPIQPENIADLRRAVLDEGADIGLAFDGDADRVFLVDEGAEPVSGSLTTALVAKRILSHRPGSTIVHNVICSRVVPEVIAEGGGKAVRSRVGHSFIKQLMAETGAVFAGEHSGHYYFADNFRADSGILAALYVLEMMSAEGKPLSELLAPLKRYAASGEINVVVGDQQAVIERIAGVHSDGDIDRLDGLTVSYDDWWFNVRPSNTEPLLRLNVEANDEALMATKRDALVRIMKEG
jgi:phosphomannomutase